jgi:MYXO-CTERM domain-containing protein
VAAMRRQCVGDSAAAVAGRRQCKGDGGGGSTPAAAGLAAAVAVWWHRRVSFKNSATFMASDQEPSGEHAQHVQPVSDVQHNSLAYWEANSIVLQQILIVKWR